MFAVPGWSLSASDLKRQTEIPQSSKKRKRKAQAEKNAASKVTSGEVERLWKSNYKDEDSSKNSSQKANGKHPKNERKKNNSVAEDNQETPSIEHQKLKKQNQSNEPKSTEEPLKPVGSDPKPQRRVQQSLPPPTPNGAKLTPMQSAMRAKLISARFRHLNETLYTTSSANASNLFSQNPAFFNEYHEGFRQQVETWPENPIDCFLKEIEQRSNTSTRPQKDSNKTQKHRDKKQPSTQTEEPETSTTRTSSPSNPLPRTHGACTIADLGAGDATLAQRLITNSLTTQYQLKIQSYDLAAPNSLVTKADIANLPLPDGSINLAIFCLALMGTNWPDFIDEAWRILHWKGELWVAEIKSRFTRENPQQKSRVVEHSISDRQRKKRGLDVFEQQREQSTQNELLRKHVDGVEDANAESTDVSVFIEVLKKRGFAIEGEPDLRNKMFVRMRFVKVLRPVKGKNVGKDLQQGKKQRMKFLDEEEGDERDDSEVLKPCLYKLR